MKGIDWEVRFKQSYEVFQAEKKQICYDYENKIAEMKAMHAKEIEATVSHCVEKVEKSKCEVAGLKRRVNILQHENNNLEMENGHLEYILHDIQATNTFIASQMISQDETPECGYVELTNASCYQDFVGILINNGYAVEIDPIKHGTTLAITIKESGDK